MDINHKQVLIEQFVAELLLLPDEYLNSFGDMFATFREQVELMERQKLGIKAENAPNINTNKDADALFAILSQHEKDMSNEPEKNMTLEQLQENIRQKGLIKTT